MKIKVLSFLASLFYFLGVLFSNNISLVKKHITKTKDTILENSKEKVKNQLDKKKENASFKNFQQKEKKKEMKKSKK